MGHNTNLQQRVEEAVEKDNFDPFECNGKSIIYFYQTGDPRCINPGQSERCPFAYSENNIIYCFRLKY
jgi:hypothetical protein